MKQKQVTGYILSLSLVSMLLILGLQAYWIKDAYDRANEEFSQRVTKVLKQVEQKVEGILMPKMVLNSSDNQTKTIYHLSSEPNNYKFTYTEVYTTPYVENTDTITKLDAIKKLALQLKGLNQDSLDKGENTYILVYLHAEKGYDALAEKIKSLPMDSILLATFRENDITVPFDYGVYSIAKNTWHFKVQQFSSDTALLKSKYWVSLFGNQENSMAQSSATKIIVYFPSNRAYLFHKLIYVLLPTVIILLILGFVIWYLLRTVFEQKKLTALKNDFINNMTHELKTPIATIQFAVANIESEQVISSPEKIRTITKVIKEESEHMNTHVEMVLKAAQASRKELELKKEQVDVHALLMGLLERFRGKLVQPQAAINSSLLAQRYQINGDVLHLTNVFSNLLDNAIKYSNNNIDILVKSSSDEAGLTIQISDMGMGMTKEHLDKIFDPFYRVSTGNIHNIKGFGLGLSYAKEIVTEHGGHITVQSKPDRGSTFSVFLPFNQSVQ